MSQIFHIFRKDIRRHWIEIAVCQIALIAYFWRQMRDWYTVTRHSLGIDIPEMLIDVLLPLAWAILIIRVIQSESLVGDSQFWTTRPYEWKKLLGAKALFIAAFLCAPLLVAQIFVLARAGFSPWSGWFGLAWMQLLLVCMPILSLMALASVTKNFVQAALTLFIVVLITAGLAILSNTLPNSSMSSSDESDSIQLAVLVLASLMAVWLQYKKRNAFRSRMFLGAAALVIALMVSCEPLLVHNEKTYLTPLAGGFPEFHAGTYSNKPASTTSPSGKNTSARTATENVPPRDEPVELNIPLETSGLVNGTFGQINGILLVLDTPDGSHWSSNWQSSYRFLLPGQSRTHESFKMDYDTYNRLKSTSLKAHVSVALHIYRDQGNEIVTATKEQFAVSGVGRCWIDPESENQIHCHSPLIKPHTLLLRVDPSDSTCPKREDADDSADDADDESETPSVPVFAWEINGDSAPAEFGFNPVESMELYLSQTYTGRQKEARICPGTPLTFSFPHAVAKIRADFDIDGVKLSDYLPPKSKFYISVPKVRVK